ncbi:MAG TPA: S1 RNA-binding domain-containing protein [Candidatus Kapabacteria bacterium]|nr:S1 RNA-binding domain-containing protein [Candidatus Kapabacteria bacterium]
MADDSFVINPSNDNTNENFDNNEIQNSEDIQPNQNENFKPSDEQVNFSSVITESTESIPIAENPIEVAQEPVEIGSSEDSNKAIPDSTVSSSVSEEIVNPTIETDQMHAKAEEENIQKTHKHSESSKSHKAPKPQINQEVLETLKSIKEAGQTIFAKVEDRVNGGLRLNYEGLPIFLPISHFSFLDINQISEEDLIRTVGDLLEVEILEINDEVPAHKRNIIASRKNVIEKKFFQDLKIGTIVEGTISSIANFGVFVDLGGVEGLVHISRISRKHIDDPRTIFKKGDKVKAVVIGIDPIKKKISLSIADLEKGARPTHQFNIAEKYPVSSIHNVKVKRFVDFGVFVELENGLDGLIRNQELSWTQRVNNPREILQQDQEIQAQVISINPEKNLVSLSYRNTSENPWPEIEKNFKIGDIKNATIKQIRPEGAIVTIDNDIDGFLPKSKMKGNIRNGKFPFKKGDTIEVKVADVIASQHSIILEMIGDETQGQPHKIEQENQQKHTRRTNTRANEEKQVAPMLISESKPNNVGNFSFAELIDEQMKKLLDNNNN